MYSNLMKEMNILYAIDEGNNDYSRYLGVSILSLLEHNKDENICIYVLSQFINESNKEELIRIVEGYGKKIFFSKGEIVPDEFKKILRVNPLRPFTVFYRLFFHQFKISDRVLYLDCDTIVNKNLGKIYNSNFEGNVFMGTLDSPLVLEGRRRKYGIENYINAGVCLINIDLYNKYNLYEEIKGINTRFGYPDCNDQDYINLIFQGKIKINNELQCLIYYKRKNYKLTDYYITHTIRKPNEGGLGFCPKYIEEIFNYYLKKTKRSHYVMNRKKYKIKEYFAYVYSYFTFFIEYKLFSFFGWKSALCFKNFYAPFGRKLGNFARKMGL